MSQPQFTLTVDTDTSDFAKVIIEPLPQGYGHTLGNSLRRVLYSSIPGAAITSISISGASHQFTSLPGVTEDGVELVLNLKQVRLRYSGEKPVKIKLSAHGPGEVKAGQFQIPPEVKIANPDFVIAKLAEKTSKLEIEAVVESGLGYSPAEDRKSTTIGMIPVDASFTPVIRVNYLVEATRVGRVTNYDRLVLEIHTDGTLAPQEALKSAAAALVDYFSLIVNPQAAVLPTSTSSSSPRPTPGAAISIEELDLPTRISNALIKAGFDTVASLLAVPKTQLAKVKNLGSKSVKIIDLSLRERGFELT